MKLRRANGWLATLGAVALTGILACERNQPAERQASEQPAAEPGGIAQSDWGITTAIQAKYFTDDMVKGRNIDVSTNEGVVTLRGTVDSQTAKEQAVNLARSVEGVSRVDDQLQVVGETAATTGTGTPAPAAGDARDQAGEAARDARTEADEAARDTRAAGERTAESIEDRLSPAWITTKIQAQYFANPEIKPWNIDVTTARNGVVTLRGEVEDQSDRQQAVQIAKNTEGVTEVRDELRVRNDAATSEPEESASVAEPDAWLTTKIQSKYFLDEEIRGRDIDVDTSDGVVTLSGTVRDEAEKRQAVALARNTDGVKEVRDELRIDAGLEPVASLPPPAAAVEPLTDEWITTKIQARFFIDEDVKGTSVNVDTRNGVVTLQGRVPSESARQAAESIAKSIEGVKKVDNQITVGSR